MKMPSTYISLFLFCGLMFFYSYAHHHARHFFRTAPGQPVVTINKLVVKRFSTGQQSVFHLYKNKEGYEKELHRARLTINGFSFFRDVICNIVPVLKHGG